MRNSGYLSNRSGRVGIGALVMCALVLCALWPSASAKAASTDLTNVLNDARAYADTIPTTYIFSAEGQVQDGVHEFDCSGFIYALFKDNGLTPLIGNQRMSVQGYLDWFRAQGRAHVPAAGEKPSDGDLVVYQADGDPSATHMGIYDLQRDRVINAATFPRSGVQQFAYDGIYDDSGNKQKIVAYLRPSYANSSTDNTTILPNTTQTATVHLSLWAIPWYWNIMVEPFVESAVFSQSGQQAFTLSPATPTWSGWATGGYDVQLTFNGAYHSNPLQLIATAAWPVDLVAADWGGPVASAPPDGVGAPTSPAPSSAPPAVGDTGGFGPASSSPPPTVTAVTPTPVSAPTLLADISPSGAQAGASLTVHAVSGDPSYNTIRVTLPCGSPSAYELGAPQVTFTWSTGGCGGGPQPVAVQARTASDTTWAHAIGTIDTYPLSPNSVLVSANGISLDLDPGTVPAGAAVTVHATADDPTYNTIRVTMPCGNPPAGELGAPTETFTWSTQGCSAGSYAVLAQARHSNDPNWSQPISVSANYTIAPALPVPPDPVIPPGVGSLVRCGPGYWFSSCYANGEYGDGGNDAAWRGADADLGTQWSSLESLNSYWQATFVRPVTVGQVAIWGRGGGDGLSGRLEFSDGSTVDFGTLNGNGCRHATSFPSRQTTYVRFHVTGMGNRSTTGFKDFQAYAYKLVPDGDDGTCAHGPLVLDLSAGTADLAVASAASASRVTIGQQVSFSTTVTNTGPSTATNVAVTQTFSADVHLVSTQASKGTCAVDESITCSIGSLASGESATFSIALLPKSGTSLSGASSISSDQFDPAASNNSASQTVALDPAPLPVVLTTQPASVAAGGVVSVAWSQFTPTGNDWISMHPAGAPDSQYLDWKRIAGTAGSIDFTAPLAEGGYEFRLFSNGPKVATSNVFQVSVPSVPLVGIGLSPTSVVGGSAVTATVTLAAAAPGGGSTISLATSDPSASAPVSVTVPAGATQASFAIATLPVAAQTSLSVTASSGSSTRSATLTIKSAALASVSLSPSNVVGSSPSTGTVKLNGAAPAGGVVVSLATDNSSATLPATVSVPANATSVPFTVTTTGVASTLTAHVSANLGATTKTAALNINPPGLTGFTFPSTAVAGGCQTISGTLTLAAPVTVDTAVGLTITNGSTAVSAPPASVVVLAGSKTATLSMTTSGVSTTTSVSVTATVNGSSRSATFKVRPPVASAVTIAPASVKGGAQATGLVTVDCAPSTDLVVTLKVTTSGAAIASLPATATIPSGSTAGTFTVITSTVTVKTTEKIHASAGGVAKTASLTVNP